MLAKPKSIKFQRAKEGEFYSIVKGRVEEYFREKKISRYANWKIHSKILLFFTLYLLLIGVIFSNALTGVSLIACYAVLGFVTSLICCNFCHDVMHGAYFSSPKLTKLLGYVYDLNGMSSGMWKISHNLRHHTFTNIPGVDEDIDKAILLRLSPTDKLYPFHRFQHIYAFLLYFFTSLNWAYYGDIKSFIEERKNISRQETLTFFALKALNLLIFLFLPMVLLSAPNWQIFLGFLSMHFVGGFFSAIIFQLGHVVENVSFPEPDPQGHIQNRWAIHEMQTTSNFGTDSKFWGWFVGGLNYQIEHHLFPYICHVHYPEICKIMKQTAHECQVPYHEQPTFTSAILSHIRMLKKFGLGQIVEGAEPTYSKEEELLSHR